MLGSLRALKLGKETRQVLIDQPLFHFRHRKDVAIADDQVDVVQRDALGLQAIVDHFLVEAAGVLLARDPLFRNGECDGAVAQQTGTHVVVVGIQAEYVRVLFGHGDSFWRIGDALKSTMVIELKSAVSVVNLFRSSEIAHCTICSSPVQTTRRLLLVASRGSD
jgi:hypothetical protein